jgi:hypothetical protein
MKIQAFATGGSPGNSHVLPAEPLLNNEQTVTPSPTITISALLSGEPSLLRLLRNDAQYKT